MLPQEAHIFIIADPGIFKEGPLLKYACVSLIIPFIVFDRANSVYLWYWLLAFSEHPLQLYTASHQKYEEVLSNPWIPWTNYREVQWESTLISRVFFEFFPLSRRKQKPLPGRVCFSVKHAWAHTIISQNVARYFSHPHFWTHADKW